MILYSTAQRKYNRVCVARQHGQREMRVRERKIALSTLGFDHPGGSGKLGKLSCGVIFYIFIPTDLHYILFVAVFITSDSAI
jgi:hypothetical protein